MYNKMKFKEKINYFYSFLKVPIILLLLSIPFFFFASGKIVGLLMMLDLILIFISLILILSNYYIFTKNVQITDGYISERFEHGYDNGKKIVGVAKTLDGSKETKTQRIPFWFRHGQVPVKIIIYNGKAKKFLLDDESYKYAKEHCGEMEKKTNTNSSIIGIILLVLLIIVIINVLISFYA